MEKLVRKLKRELARSPGKSATLLVACLIASYFYVPLLNRLWKSPSSEPIASTSGAAEATPFADFQQFVPPATEPQSAKNRLGWLQIANLLVQDPLMRATSEISSTDPFAIPWIQKRPLDEESASNEALDSSEPSVRTPAQLGLVLVSTMVSPNRRLAMINGRTYRENSQVVVGAGNGGRSVSKKEKVVFRLVRIYQSFVELESQGAIYRLDLAKNKLGRDSETIESNLP